MSLKHLLRIIPAALLLSATMAAAPIALPLPGQSSTFTGNVRGYWFTAPVDFRIVGLRVPTDASSAAQSIELVRLDAPPPQYSTVTNSFTSLFRVVNDNTAGFLTVDIAVSAGDVIGVLGQRGGVNSYGPGNFVSSIFGQNVTLARLGMQLPLATNVAQSLWTEAGGSISRVEMLYDSPAQVPEPTTYAMVGGALVVLALRRRKSAK